MHKFLKLSTAVLLLTSSICNAEIPVEIVPVEQDVTTTQQPYGFTLGPKFRIGFPSGIGAEAALAINQNFVVKGNIAYLPETDLISSFEKIASWWGVSLPKTAGSDAKIMISNFNFMALVDWHPFGGSFMLSAGGAYNKAGISITNKMTAQQVSAMLSLPSDATPPEIAQKIDITQTDNLFFVSGIGFDNSNDLESRFNYGITCDIMWGKPPAFTATQSFTTNAKLADAVQKSLDAANSPLAGSLLSTAINSGIEQFAKEKIGLSILPIPSLTFKFGIALQ